MFSLFHKSATASESALETPSDRFRVGRGGEPETWNPSQRGRRV